MRVRNVLAGVVVLGLFFAATQPSSISTAGELIVAQVEKNPTIEQAAGELPIIVVEATVEEAAGGLKDWQVNKRAAADQRREERKAAPTTTTPVDIPCPKFDDANPRCVEAFRLSLRWQESRNNYGAVGPMTRYGHATGAYQWIPSTWASHCQCDYANAKDAPAEFQDEIAVKAFLNYHEQWGLWSLVARGWHGGPGAVDKFLRNGTSGSHDGITSTDQYSADVIERASRIEQVAS